jgi:hypothetical protein
MPCSGSWIVHTFPFILTGSTCIAFDASSYAGTTIPSNLTVEGTSVGLALVNNHGWAVGNDNSANPIVWTGTATGFTQLAPIGMPIAMNGVGQVVAESGTSGYLWTSGSTTSVCPLVHPGNVQQIISLIPAPYQSRIQSINPISISGTNATDGSIRILFNGTYQTDSAGGTNTGTFLLTLASGTSGITSGTAESIFRQVILPSNVSINLGGSNGVGGITGTVNAQSLIAAVGASPTHSGNDAFLLLPVTFIVTNFNPATALGGPNDQEAQNSFTAGNLGIQVDTGTNIVGVQINVAGPASVANTEASNWSVDWIQQMNSFDAQRIYASSVRTDTSSASPPFPLMDCAAQYAPFVTGSLTFTGNNSTVNPFWGDGPHDINIPWNDPSNGNGNPITKWHFNGSFTTWLVAFRKGSNNYVYLKNIQWGVQNSATINATKPVGQRVSITQSANIQSCGDGVGPVNPVLTAPLAFPNTLKYPDY